MNDNNITIVGNVTADPELRFTNTGKAFATFTVAHNSRRRDESGQWVDGDATFVRCVAWQELAENLAETLSKGDRAIVVGSLAIRKYTDKTDDTEKWITEIKVQEVGPSLKWATAAPTRTKRDKTDSPTPAPEPVDPGEPF